MKYMFDATVKRPGEKMTPVYTSVVEASTREAAHTAAMLQTTYAMNVPAVAVRKMVLREVQ